MKRESETSCMAGNALLLGKSELGPAATAADRHANLDPAGDAAVRPRHRRKSC
jgi:hypothetical protein